jgi:hypothetical protein
MKVLKIALIALFVPVLFAACSKDKTENSSESAIMGRWIGAYGFDNDNPNVYYSLNFKSGGVIEEVNSNGQVIGSGTWEMNGNTITAHYAWLPPSTATFSIVAGYYPSQGKLLGNWGYDASATDGGLWEMTKQ